MAQSTQVELQGVINATPSLPSAYCGTAQQLLPLSFCATYGASKGGVIPVASSDGSPFNLPLEGINKVRMFAIRLASGATMKVRITTALGVANVPVSGQFLFHSPAPGDEITAIALIGTGDVTYAIAGDVA